MVYQILDWKRAVIVDEVEAHTPDGAISLLDYRGEWAEYEGTIALYGYEDEEEED